MPFNIHIDIQEISKDLSHETLQKYCQPTFDQYNVLLTKPWSTPSFLQKAIQFFIVFHFIYPHFIQISQKIKS